MGSCQPFLGLPTGSCICFCVLDEFSWLWPILAPGPSIIFAQNLQAHYKLLQWGTSTPLPDTDQGLLGPFCSVTGFLESLDSASLPGTCFTAASLGDLWGAFSPVSRGNLFMLVSSFPSLPAFLPGQGGCPLFNVRCGGNGLGNDLKV